MFRHKMIPYMKKNSSGMKQNNFYRIILITGLIYYLECKFSELERNHNDYLETITEQITRNNMSKIKSKNDMREVEIRKKIEVIMAEIRAEN